MYSVTVLHNSNVVRSFPGPVMYYQEKIDEDVQFVGFVYLLRGGGRTILVDAGLGALPDPLKPTEAQVIGNFRIEPGMDTLSLLAGQGLGPEQVDYLILTHLHYDHCANARLFPRAQILISERGWRDTMAPAHSGMVPAHLFPRDLYAYLLAEAWDRVRLLPDEAEILPGLSVFWVGGHTPCSQAVKVATARGTVIITGDVVMYYGNIEENIPVACLTNLAECYLAMDRIRAEADIIVPSHDPLLIQRYPDGRVA